MGDRSDQAPRQYQPAAGRRARCAVGRVHRFARATCRPGGDQGAGGARLPQAGGCRKSARILSGPNCALGTETPNAVFVMSTVSKGAINERRKSTPKEL